MKISIKSFILGFSIIISDNRYVECHYLGDNIEKFSVVDSEDRLYTMSVIKLWQIL